MRRLLLVFVGLAALCASVAVSSSEGATRPRPRWVLTDLGEIGRAVAINDSGQVVGSLGGYPEHAFIWRKGRRRDLGSLGGPSTSAVAINRQGQIAGTSEIQRQDEYGLHASHAFLWQKGRMRDLGTLGGDYLEVVTLTDRGQVIGNSAVARKPQPTHAFLWQRGKLVNIGTLGGLFSDAVAANNQGQIIGNAEVKRFKWRSFLWQNGKMTPLDPRLSVTAINDQGEIVGSGPNGSPCFLWQKGKTIALGLPRGGQWGSCEPVAINDHRQIAGTVSAKSVWPFHAFFWERGKVIDLGTLPGERNSRAVAINDRGQVIGYSWTEEEHGTPVAPRLFVWQSGKLTELPRLGGTAPNSSMVTAINERNQIVGWSATKDGPWHAVLWTLQP